MDPAKVINDALFTEDYEEMIVQRDIDFYSFCEHHMLPFFGKAHVAYIPHHKIVGISKLARLVDVLRAPPASAGAHDQPDRHHDHGKTRRPGRRGGLEAEHLCMRMRGVEKQNSYVITSSLLGAFRTRQETRNEFMNLDPAQRLTEERYHGDPAFATPPPSASRADLLVIPVREKKLDDPALRALDRRLKGQLRARIEQR